VRARAMASPFDMSVVLALSLLLPEPLEDGEMPTRVSLDKTAQRALAKWVRAETSAVRGVRQWVAALPWAAARSRLARAFGDDASTGEAVAAWATSRLEDVAASPDAVVDALDDMRRWLEPLSDGDARDADGCYAPRLDKDSIFGVFVRRTLLAATRSHFDGALKTYDALGTYVRDYDEGAFASDDERYRFYASTLARRHLDRFLEKRILGASAACAHVTLEETEDECDRAEALEPDLPRASYLRFVASLHHREFQAAIDHLHRYFDYAHGPGGPTSPNDDKGARGVVQYAALNLACLHFRFGHARLAATALDEAVRVAQQRHDHACVTFCLAWLKHVDAAEAEVDWELHGGPLPGEDDGTVDSGALQRAAKRAKELGLRELEAAATLAFARDCLDFGEPDDIIPHERLTRAYAPSNQHEAALAAWNLLDEAAKFESPGERDGPDPNKLLHTPQERLARDAERRRQGLLAGGGALPAGSEIKERRTLATDARRDVMNRSGARRHAVASSIYGHFGFRRMQALSARALLLTERMDLERERIRKGLDKDDVSQDAPEDGAPHVMRQLAVADIAFNCLFGDFELGDRSERETVTGAAVVAALVAQDQLGMPPELTPDPPPEDGGPPMPPVPTHKVAYAEALEALELGRCANRKSTNVGLRAEYMIKFEWALHRNALRRATDFGEAVLGVSPAQSDLDIEAHVEALRCDFRISAQRGDWDSAVKGLNRLERLCGNQGLWAQQVGCLLLGAKWRLDACPMSPVPAMSPCLRALALCELHCFDAFHAEATARLGMVQLHLGDVLKARTLLRAALPKVLEHGHIDVQGDVWYALAMTELKEKAFAKDAPEVWKHITPTLCDWEKPTRFLERALECFAYVEHRSRMQTCHYWLARIHHQEDSAPYHKAKRDFHSYRALQLQAQMNRSLFDHEELREMWLLDDDEVGEHLAAIRARREEIVRDAKREYAENAAKFEADRAARRARGEEDLIYDNEGKLSYEKYYAAMQDQLRERESWTPPAPGANEPPPAPIREAEDFKNAR